MQRGFLGVLYADGLARLAEVEGCLRDRPLERRVRDELQVLKELGWSASPVTAVARDGIWSPVDRVAGQFDGLFRPIDGQST